MIITKIEREKGYTYRVEKDGSVVKEKYNWCKDPYTLVAIAIVVLSLLYYMQISEMKTTEKNFEQMCLNYYQARSEWMAEHPGQFPTLEEVYSYKKGNDNMNG